MIPSVRTGALTVASSAAKAVFGSLKGGISNQIRSVSQIKTNDEIEICPSCKKAINVSSEYYKKALLGGKSYEDLSTLRLQCGDSLSDNFDRAAANCLFANTVIRVNAAIPDENKPSLIYNDRKSTLFISSTLLKRNDLTAGQSDLTGDGGTLALGILGDKVQEFEGNVVDIGGQDGSFLGHFSNAQERILIDINEIAYALNNNSQVKVAQGSADVVLSDKNFLPPSNRPETIFSMSNFLNVLSIKDSLNMLKVTIEKMNPGDTLVITNLHRDHFLEKKGGVSEGEKGSEEVKHGYKEGPSDSGLYEFNRKSTGKHYKTTIGDGFIEYVQKTHPEVDLVESKQSSLDCQIKRMKPIPVKFITLVYEKK